MSINPSYKPPRKRCRPMEEGTLTADMVSEVCARLDAFLDALEPLLAALDTLEEPIEGLGDLELEEKGYKT